MPVWFLTAPQLLLRVGTNTTHTISLTQTWKERQAQSVDVYTSFFRTRAPPTLLC